MCRIYARQMCRTSNRCGHSILSILMCLHTSLDQTLLIPTFPAMSETKRLPQCWGHRGASVSFPENTIASFEAAIRDGVDGIESDVHVSKDNG
ncbi:PLC-like phosphodiesterase [Mycena sp. CBHHK59/15]|nr:PLC-like phosphodiesterase [Mycena sp. CBHHK59/15]